MEYTTYTKLVTNYMIMLTMFVDETTERLFGVEPHSIDIIVPCLQGIKSASSYIAFKRMIDRDLRNICKKLRIPMISLDTLFNDITTYILCDLEILDEKDLDFIDSRSIRLPQGLIMKFLTVLDIAKELARELGIVVVVAHDASIWSRLLPEDVFNRFMYFIKQGVVREHNTMLITVNYSNKLAQWLYDKISKRIGYLPTIYYVQLEGIVHRN